MATAVDVARPDGPIVALISDLDGTLIDHDQDLSPLARASIARLRAGGTRFLIATGRRLPDLRRVVRDVGELCDGIVAENGAIVVVHGLRHQLAPAFPADLTEALRERGIDAIAGDCLLECDAAAAPVVLEEIDRLGLDAQLIRNRGRLMVTAAGVSKGTGVRVALGLLGVSQHSSVSVGDAENDISMLMSTEIGIAVDGATPRLRRLADRVLPPGSDVVAALMEDSLFAGGRSLPRRWRLTLGLDEERNPVVIPASQANLLIAGPSGAGKSYVAGMLTEQLISMGYTALVIDPEGDHTDLASVSDTAVCGGREPLPTPHRVQELLGHRFGSVVVDCSMTPRDQVRSYLRHLRRALDQLRRDRGLPHWIVVDEAHWLGEADGVAGTLFHGDAWGLCLSTFRPQDLDAAARRAIDIIVAVSGADVGIRNAVAQMASEGLGLDAGAVEEQLRSLRSHELLVVGAEGIRRVTSVAPRFSHHIRHWHKYQSGQLAEPLRFYFCHSGGRGTGRVAANLEELVDGIRYSDEDSLRHHVHRHDFSRWVAQVIHDVDLAGALAVAEGQPGDVEDLRQHLDEVLRFHASQVH